MREFNFKDLLKDDEFGDIADYVAESILDIRSASDITYERFMDQLTFEIDYAQDKICNPSEFDLDRWEVKELKGKLAEMQGLLERLERME